MCLQEIPEREKTGGQKKGDYYLSDRIAEHPVYDGKLFELCCIIEYRRRDRSDRIAKISGVQAFLLTGQTGNMGGHAVADVLNG